MIVAGVDIGGTKIAVGLMDENGHLYASESMPTEPQLGAEHAVQRISQVIRAQTAETGAVLDGIGIGCTGPVDPFTEELGVIDFLPGWIGRGLVDGLRSQFAVRLALENDADAAALAEGRWGSGRNSRSFLYLTISTGIGAGLLLNGHLYRGVDGAHPEIGHQIIDPSGPACFCGANGCWESLTSGPSMARWYTAQLPTPPSDAVTASQVCDWARLGDPLACLAVERSATYIGMGLSNLITCLVPERIALGGGMMRSWDLFEPRVRQVIRQSCGLVPAERTTIALAELGPETGLLGAAQAWYHRFLS